MELTLYPLQKLGTGAVNEITDVEYAEPNIISVFSVTTNVWHSHQQVLREKTCQVPLLDLASPRNHGSS